MKKKVITITAVALFFILQWPVGFGKGYQIKDRELCELVTTNPNTFKYAAGAIIKGESHEGRLQTRWYSDGLKKGMLYSLKQCFDGENEA
ncbi:hypothetical protein [Thalassotalea fusca]